MVQNMFGFIGVLVASSIIQSTYTGAVSDIKPCKADDKKCLIASTQLAIQYFTKGIPELGIPVIDPLLMDSARLDVPNLIINFKNLIIYGNNKTQILDVIREKSQITVLAEVPLKVKGEYDINGKVLFLELVQKGNFQFIVDKVRYTVKLNIKTVKGGDGKDYWKVTGFDLNYDLVEKLVFKIDAAHEDVAISKLLEDVLNENIEIVKDDIGTPIVMNVWTLIVENIKKLLLAFPVEDLEIS